MNQSLTDRRRALRLAPLWFALSLWASMLVLFTVTAAIVNSEPWTVSLKHSLSFWCMWIFFFPIIAWVSLMFPLDRARMLSQIGLHLIVFLLVITASETAYRTFLWSPHPPDEKERASHGPPRPRSPGMRVVPDILIYLFTVSACVAFAHYQKAQDRERRAIELEASLAQAKLQALRMQINPHFLFNTLNAISTLVHTSPQMADDMITDLSELFRSSLESSNEHEVTLSRELEMLQRYLDIEQRRFGPRLVVEQTIDPEILRARVPTLILQPIVENAIRHGIESQTEIGTIAIRAAREGNFVKLSVSDNGKKPLDAAAGTDQRQGIGLANTQARLQQLYGGEQSFIIERGPLGGWTVAIKIPLNTAAIAPAPS